MRDLSKAAAFLKGMRKPKVVDFSKALKVLIKECRVEVKERAPKKDDDLYPGEVEIYAAGWETCKGILKDLEGLKTLPKGNLGGEMIKLGARYEEVRAELRASFADEKGKDITEVSVLKTKETIYMEYAYELTTLGRGK